MCVGGVGGRHENVVPAAWGREKERELVFTRLLCGHENAVLASEGEEEVKNR